MHEAKAPVRPLRGQTVFERLMQTVPHAGARLAELYAYYYVHACAEQLGVELNENARTFVEALGGSVAGLDLVKVDEAAWRLVRDYLEAEACELVARLWGESFELPLEEKRGV
jgi:hypothetical protein